MPLKCSCFMCGAWKLSNQFCHVAPPEFRVSNFTSSLCTWSSDVLPLLCEFPIDTLVSPTVQILHRVDKMRKHVHVYSVIQGVLDLVPCITCVGFRHPMT